MKANVITTHYLEGLREGTVAQTEAMKKLAKKAAKKTLLGILLLGIILAVVVCAIVAATRFYDKNTVIIKLPWEVSVKTNQVLVIVPRIKTVVVSEKTEKVAEIVAKEENKDLATYICEKWGVVECRTALAVAKAESGMRCDAVNVNTNGTADLSVYQLNTTHLRKGGEWTLANMANCLKNVDLAYELWQAQGWNPWVAYTSGSYLARL